MEKLTENKINKTIANTFNIIDVIANANAKIGVSELSRKAHLPKTTVFRLLDSLEQLKIVNKNDDQEYNLGSFFYKFVAQAKNKNDLVQIALPFMKEFAKKTGETINLGILYNSEVVYLKSITGKYFSLQVKLIPVAPLYCSSIGKLFLSTFSTDKLSAYLKNVDLKKMTVNTITEIRSLKKELNQIKQQHFSYDREESEYGLSCIALPIIRKKRIVAAISVSGPTARMKVYGFKKIKTSLKLTAEKINMSML